MKKILTMVLLLGVTETAIVSQTYPAYPTGRTGPVAYYPTYSTNAAPTPALFPTLPAPIPTFSDGPVLTFAIVRSNGTLWNEIRIRGKTWTTYVVESSVDLKTWVKVEEVKTGLLGGRVVRVPFETSLKQKFFRLVK